jgi:hypothetical protein
LEPPQKARRLQPIRSRERFGFDAAPWHRAPVRGGQSARLAFTITATCRKQNLTTESMTVLSREIPKTTQPADSAALLS